MLSCPSYKTELLNQYNNSTKTPYNFETDNAGRIIWYETAKRISTDYPLEIQDVEYSKDGIQNILEQIIAQFKHLVEGNSLYKLFYNDDKTRKREDTIQLLFFCIADKYCKDNNHSHFQP